MYPIKTTLLQLSKYIKRRPFKSFGYLILTGAFFVFLLFLMTYWGMFGKIPSEIELKSLRNPITSTIYGSDGEPIGYYYLQNRSNIDSTQMNPFLVHALVATEDFRFYRHRGIDYKSYFRVLIKSVLLRQDAGGGSTITQQIAKNLFGRKKQFFMSTPINKIRELYIARRLENIYNKNELILLYLNTVSFGENLYGIEKAAYRFFGKKPEELSLTESATLIGVLKAPTFYNPRNNPERAEERRNVVLQQMLKHQYIDEKLYDVAKGQLTLNYTPPEKISSLTTYYIEYVKEEFNRWAQENPNDEGHIFNLESDGLKIYTTINPNVQKYLERAMTRQIERLQQQMETYWTSATIEGGKDALIQNLIEDLPQIKTLKAKGKSLEEIDAFVNTKKDRKYWEMGKGLASRQQSLKDSIVAAITRLHTGIVAINSKSGRIMGYLGGIDYGFSQTDHNQNIKQVGSLFKPITYLTALESGEDPCNYYDNVLRTYSEFENWKPRNADNMYGGSYSMHGALANSVNTASVALQFKIGNERVLKMAKKMGISSEIPDVPSMVLGTAELTLLEMVQAYATISNGGYAITPFAIDRIETQDGEVLYEAKINYRGRIANEKSIQKLQKMMEEVTNEGSGKGLSFFGIPFNIIGKTGTTQNNGDGWFIGCSPEIVVGAWVGTMDKRVQFGRGSGAQTALPIVASIFKSLSSWKNPMLTNFEFDTPYFNCPMFTELSANEAYTFYKSDTTYIQQLKIRDSLKILGNTKIDTLSAKPIKEIDSLKIDTFPTLDSIVTLSSDLQP